MFSPEAVASNRARPTGFLVGLRLTPRQSFDLPPSPLPAFTLLAALGSTLAVMARKRLTLEELVEGGRFRPEQWRHRRALDESGPLEDPELEAARQHVLDFRLDGGGKFEAARALQEFAELVQGAR
jgi:hypothetical protein